MAGENGVEWIYGRPGALPHRRFPGGLYAVCTDADGQAGAAVMDAEVLAFLQSNGFEPDPTRRRMGNVITPPEAEEAMSYQQTDYYRPIRPARASDHPLK